MAEAKQPKIILTYFNGVYGRGGPIRDCFNIAKIPFEDKKIDFADWPGVKGTTPFGNIPVLSVDGKELSQSNACLVYAGKLSKLYPQDAFEAARVDEILNACEDINGTILKAYFEQDPVKKSAYIDEQLSAKGQIHKWLSDMEKVIKRNGSKAGYSTGESLTVADLKITGTVYYLNLCGYPKNVLDAFPLIAQVYANKNKIIDTK